MDPRRPQGTCSRVQCETSFLDTHELPHQYTAHATARGLGRNGQVESEDDAALKLQLSLPKALGGRGGGQNPEQLFAMGYAGTHNAFTQMSISGIRCAIQLRTRTDAS